MKKEVFASNKVWLAVAADDLKPGTDFYKTYEFDDEILTYALDKNERAHMEYDKTKQTMLVIYNVLNRKKDENHYETVPMTFLIQNDTLISLYSPDNMYIIEMMTKYLSENQLESVYQLLFVALFLISEGYFPYLEDIDESKDAINRRLRQKTTKKDLLALSDIETGMVYLLSAANQNAILLEQIKSLTVYKTLTDIDKEQLEDALIEAKQLLSMTQLNAQVLQQLSGTYNNILNNNLNDNMTTMTIISIVLAVVAVITGFFGMNVPLPLTDQKDAWLWIIGASVVLWLLIAAFLRYLLARKS